jgi:hypothetical protein
MLTGKHRRCLMQRGWEFRFGDRVYYVGAPDVEAAKYLVLQHLRSQGDVRPEEIPDSAMRFLKLADGTLIEARVFDFNELLDANRT